MTTMTVAAANVRPAWLDPDATTTIVTDRIAEAAAAGARLVAFGETFLSGYPYWVSRTGGARFEDVRQQAAYAAYLDAAVTLDGPQVARVAEAAAVHGVTVVLGITERGTAGATGTVYATLLTIDPKHGVVGAHRKLRPTHEERMVWGPGDGHGLRAHAVGGWRVGGLNCWENWMPQARHAMYADGEDLHVSIWPGSSGLTRDIVRFVAMEGRVYSLAAGATGSVDDVPEDFPLHDELHEAEASEGPLRYDGGSALAAPDGAWVVEPMDEEGLLVAQVDLEAVRRARQSFDPTGHYSRPDVFRVTVDRTRQEAVTFLDPVEDGVPPAAVRPAKPRRQSFG